MIEANIIHEAWKVGVQKLLFLGSSCIYPKLAPQPMPEDALLTGTLEPTNEPYAVAKIAGIKLCESYNRQYGTDYRSVMPTNLYGPGDNYDLQNSHVIPAMIRKLHLAKLAAERNWPAIEQMTKPERSHPRGPQVPVARHLHLESGALPHLWGTGTPDARIPLRGRHGRRQRPRDEPRPATYDAHTQPMLSHINVGTGEDITIRQLAETVGM
jgi:GDP-L-fucose synthase